MESLKYLENNCIHHWVLDSLGFGCCLKCGYKEQFENKFTGIDHWYEPVEIDYMGVNVGNEWDNITKAVENQR